MELDNMLTLQKITIDVGTEYFEFKKDDEQIRLLTCAHFQRKDNRWLPVSIGEIRDIPETVFINFFKEDEFLSNQEIDKLELLIFYIQYGIGSVLSKSIIPIIRPLIVYRGEKKLEKSLCGYQRNILEEVAYRSGARRVKFE